MSKFNLYIVFLVVLGFTFFGFKRHHQEYIKHNIKVLHPGISQKDAINCVLFETKENLLNEKQFFMDVETVVCGDKQCKIDIIRVYWNQFGNYLKFELRNGIQLEKANGLHFTKADYIKLQNILEDSNSPLKKVYKNEIVSNSSGEGFDAVSGETVLLEKHAYVKGAVWTCYTLWHWVHGNTRKIIRNITGQKYTTSALVKFLDSNIMTHNLFGLEQLIRKKEYSQESNNAVKKFLLNHKNSTKKGIKYFQEINLNTVSDILLELYQKSELQNRLLYLSLIRKKHNEFSNQNLTRLFKLIKQNITFEELNMFLEITENKQVLTDVYKVELIQLINHKNVLISRRIYWFLKDKKLTDEEKITLSTYYLKNKDKL